jgi:group I intron endonuclease
MDVSNLFNPGLYKITCLKNNKIYIGESSNVLSRLGKHVYALENNQHDCIELQNDFNKFGKIVFKFEALELNNKYLNESVRKLKEKFYIKQIQKFTSYNFQDKQNWNYYVQKVKIKGVIYNSLRQASSILNESRTN